MEKTAADLYPEILKFCSWYKKETEEKGLQYIKVKIPDGLTPEIVRWNTEEQLHLHGFELLFERAILLNSEIVEGIRGYVGSSSCTKTDEFDRLEKSCASWNRINEITTTVAHTDVF